uniref:Uncharacterized protein n=1 Tax=Ciona savignyi TaxID=51511 RepID=H2YPH0_CIOSA
MLETGSGIWCGAVFIGSGVFGVIAGNQPNKEKIKHAMLAAIPSGIFGIVMFGVEIASAASYNPNDSISNNLSKEAAVVALHSSLVILAFILIIITLVQIYFCYEVVYNKFNTATSGISNVYSTSGQMEQSHGQTAA